MLSIDEIAKEYPKELQPFKRFILKEYLQYKILDFIFKNKIGDKLSFLGGTALRIIHNNQRFSEDLDFDNFGLTAREFDLLIQKIKSDLEKEGYLVETRNVHKGAYRCYIKFPEVLFKEGLTPVKEEKILIQIDTAPHKFKYSPDVRLINKFGVFREIKSTPIEIVLSQKIYSIFNRKRPKGRDFYDVVFLFSKTSPDYKYLKLKLGINTPEKLKKELAKKCKNLNFKDLSKDVKSFIFEPRGEEKVIKFIRLVEGIE